MNTNIVKLNLNYFFLFIIWLYKCINCKELFIGNSIEGNTGGSVICTSINPSSNIFKENNYKKNDLEPEIINRIIEEGKSHTEFLNYSNIYKFTFSEVSIKAKADLLVNFYSLDCKIIIISNDEDAINITKISNYEYDVFSAVIPKDKINSSFIKIRPLIDPVEEKNKRRTYHLVINCLNKKNPELVLNEKFPSAIYFNENLDNITFSYKLNNKEDSIFFSFFIKEKARFEAKILDDETSKKIIAYKDNIIVNPQLFSIKDNKIYVSINKIDSKNCIMIVKVSGNNSPFYLQKNILNLGFMPINTSNHYYYMEIFKGEEGEIMLHNKIHNGFLQYKILNKNSTDEKNILTYFDNYFPKNDFRKYSLINQYDIFSKKLNFYSNETNDCENGCYLLITYFSPEIKLKNIFGIEYTLLARIWDEDEFKSQIVNIPLNEYVFGTIEPSFSSINTHYYSIFIPENNDIIFEFKGRNINAFVKKGIIQINVVKKPYNSFCLTEYFEKNEDIEDEKLVVKLNENKLKLTNFDNVYLSFAFKIMFDDEYSNSLINNYYFRIIQKTSENNYIIYPLDTNKINLCETSGNEQNYMCYFLLKNDYKELYNNFSIYAYGIEEANYYNVWPINQIDYSLINISKIKEQYKNKIQTRNNGGLFRLSFNESLNYILLEISSKYKEILEVLFNFDGGLISSSSLDIYSYQSFYLYNNISKHFHFNYAIENKYTVIINNTSGEGYICFNHLCDNNDKKYHFSGKIILSFTISETIKTIQIFTEKYLFFYMKIKNKIPSDIIEEIFYGSNYKNFTQTYDFTKAYYIKDIYGNGIDINFFFDFNITDNYNQDIDIIGYISNYDDLKYIDNYDIFNDLITEYSSNDNFIQGTYDPFTKSGLISFNNILSKNESVKRDIYYLFTFIIKNENISEFPVEIYIDTKNESKFILPKNKYIRGSFDLLNYKKIQSKIMYIQFEEEEKSDNINNIYIIEFSSNYQVIKPIFNDDFIFYTKKIIGGVQYYYFSSEYLKKGQKYNFTIQINNSIKNNFYNDKNLLDYLPNYIIKYYKKINDDNLDFIINKSIEYKKIIGFSKEETFYNVIIKNKQKIYNLKNDSYYTYLIRVCEKEPIYETQTLNTTALLFYNNLAFHKHETNDPNSDISFSFSDSCKNENFIFLLFIIVNDQNEKINKEKYYSAYLEIEAREEPQKAKSNINTNLIIYIIFISVFIITLVISIIVCTIYTRKNKSLKEQVQAISFSRGIDEENIDINKSKISKKDEDYESTFI